MNRILTVIIITLVCSAPWALNFKPYCVLDSATKANLLAIRHANPAFTPGNVALFGNSITYTMAFWAPYQWGTPGPVPGTNGGTYGTKNCAYSGWRITDGLGCVASACQSESPEVCIIEFGTNDINADWAGVTNGSFGVNYRRFIDTVLSYGCIPIISTIPPVRWDGNNAQWDLRCAAVNDTLKRVASSKKVALVDCWQAFMDFTTNNPWTDTWFGDHWVHPSGGADMVDTANPTCGYGIRNAVSWLAVNTVYREIIDGDTAGGGTAPILDSMDVPVMQDAWLSGCCGEENTACSAPGYAPDWMRFKGADHSEMAFQFDMSSIPVDTSKILGGTAFVRPVATTAEPTYTYAGLACALTGPWVETTITYNMANPNVTTVGSRPSSYNAAPGTAFHPFPVSAKLAKGMKTGAYSGTVIKDQSGSGINQDFATKEAGAGFEPYLRVYFSEIIDTKAELEGSSELPELLVSPNPFNPRVRIEVRSKEQGDRSEKLEIKIFNIQGNLVCRLTPDSRLLSPSLIWDASLLPSGVYIIKAVAGKKALTKQVVLQK